VRAHKVTQHRSQENNPKESSDAQLQSIATKMPLYRKRFCKQASPVVLFFCGVFITFFPERLTVFGYFFLTLHVENEKTPWL